jgi:KUP system potassium uptake protein
MALIGLSALGIVFGDLATSPLYTLQTVVQATGGKFTSESALGILSLIFWTLIITVTVKYCVFVMRADNQGEGGILALMALVGANTLKGPHAFYAAMGLAGAALIYGDGVITPAISVLSALEGVNVVTTQLKPYVMPAAVVILLSLFFVQRFGTAKIGALFGPTMLLWSVVIGVLGISGIVRDPVVLSAVDPSHALRFLVHGGPTTLLVLGGVFLCITGGEALYADMGHFGKWPIRGAWFFVVLPSLLLSYAGQTALLIQKGSIQGNPFYQLAPHWAIYPLVILATLATIIASQSIITGAFSMTRQAMQLGWMPALGIRQTSSAVYGQIYVPVVNGLMMVATIAITIAFGTSDRLAGAYGTAVSTTMLLTTCLLYLAMTKVWKWKLWIAVPLAAFFLTVDLGFFVANSLKILDGGWLPLTLAAILFLIMTTWRAGMDVVRANVVSRSQPCEVFLGELHDRKILRVPGVAVFLSRSPEAVPPSVVDHAKFMHALYETVVILNVIFEETPHVDEADRTKIEELGDGLWRVTLRFGFIEIPDLPAALARAQAEMTAFDLTDAIWFSTRGLVVDSAKSKRLPSWSAPLFAFLYRNAARVVVRFNLPPERVIEIAREVDI